MKKYEEKLLKVSSNEQITESIFKIRLEGQFKGVPGQFYMLKSWNDEPVLWRPISIHRIDDSGIEFMINKFGRGTEILSKLKENDEIKVMGPLGNGFPLDNIQGKVAVVAGGIGVAPMAFLADKIKDKVEDIHIYAGFRDESFGIDELGVSRDKITISTETGVEGLKGYVTDALDTSKYDLVICCGPEVMMHKVIRMCRETGTSIYISEEKRMACGIGACLVCTCKTKHGNKRTCSDGPVFNGDDIIL